MNRTWFVWFYKDDTTALDATCIEGPGKEAWLWRHRKDGYATIVAESEQNAIAIALKYKIQESHS